MQVRTQSVILFNMWPAFVTNTITVNTMVQFIGRVVVVVATLSGTILLRRWFGRAEYGSYIYLLNLIMLAVALADWGSHLTAVRDAAHILQRKLVLGVVCQVRVVLTIFACAGLLLTIRFIDPSYTPYMLPVSFFFVALVAKETAGVIFHAQEKLYLTVGLQIAVALLQFGVIVWVVTTGQGLYWLFGSTGIGIAVIGSLALGWIGRDRSIVFEVSISRCMRFAKSAAPLGALLVVFTIYSKIDTVMIKYFLGESAVGAYGLAYKLYDNALLPAAFVLNAWLPKLSRSAGQLNQLKSTLWIIAKILGVFCVCVLVSLLMLDDWVLPLLTNDAAKPELELIAILGLSIPFAYANHLTGYVLIALNRQLTSLWIGLLALVVNVVANLFLIPALGVVAAAWVTLLTESVVLLCSAWVVARVVTR